MRTTITVDKETYVQSHRMFVYIYRYVKDIKIYTVVNRKTKSMCSHIFYSKKVTPSFYPL